MPGERWQSARAKHNLGGLLAQQESKASQGLPLLREAKDQLERLAEEFPTMPQYRQELASVYLHLGQVEEQQKEPRRLATTSGRP